MSEVGLDFRTFIFVFMLPFLIMFGILSFYFLKDMIEWDQKSFSGNGSGYSLTEVNPGIYTIKVTVVSSFGMVVSEAVVEIKG